MSEPLQIDQAHTAILIMDYQNGIVANYAQNNPGLLDRAAAILMAGRQAHLPIIYIVVCFLAGHPEVNGRRRTLPALPTRVEMI